MTKVSAHVALTIATALSGLALGQSTAFAQAAPAPAQSGDILQEIVVTAQFRSEKLQETPLAITALSGDALESRNITSLPDIAKVAPNVTMFEASAAYGKTNAAFIRGIGQGDFNLAAGEPGVGVYVDDVYYATTFGSVLDLLDLERVEVLRGPQGTLFGKNSIGGAIRMISKKPTGDGTGYLEATLGDYNTRYIKGAYDLSLIRDKVFLRVSVMSKQKDGFVNRVDYACAHPDLGASQGYAVNLAAPRLLSNQNSGSGSCTLGTEGGQNVAGARAALRWIINDFAENTLTASVVDDKSEAAPEVGLIANPAISPQLAGYNAGYLLPTYGVNYDSRFVTSDYRTTYSTFYDTRDARAFPPVSTLHNYTAGDVLDIDPAQGVHVKLITSYMDYWGDFSDDQDNSPLPIAYAYNLLDHHQFTEELQVTGKAFNDKVDWATGAFYFRGTTLNRGHINLSFFTAGPVPTPDVPPADPRLDFNENSPAKNTNYAVFFQPTFHLTDRMDLIAGARESHEKKEYTYYSFFGQLGPYETSYSHLDWKAALNYRWTSDFMTYVSATTGFRGGGFNPRPFAAAQINSFGPEKLTEYEVGAKSEWFDHRLRANLAGFYGLYRDYQLNSQALDANGVPYTGIQNVPGGANISGGEFELEGHPVGGLVLTLSGGYTHFKYKLGNAVGCQDLGAAAQNGVNCINGNPGAGDIPPAQPKFKGNFGIAYSVLLPDGSKLTPRLDMTYQTEVFADVINNSNPLARMPGRTLTDGRVTWDSNEGRWTVAGFVTNLTNKRYYVSIFDLTAFGEGQMSGQPGAPREWGVTARYNFGSK